MKPDRAVAIMTDPSGGFRVTVYPSALGGTSSCLYTTLQVALDVARIWFERGERAKAEGAMWK